MDGMEVFYAFDSEGDAGLSDGDDIAADEQVSPDPGQVSPDPGQDPVPDQPGDNHSEVFTSYGEPGGGYAPGFYPLGAEIVERLDVISELLQDTHVVTEMTDPQEVAELSPMPSPTEDPVLQELQALRKLQEDQSTILGDMSGDVYMLRRPMNNINNAILVVTVGIGILIGVKLMSILSMYLRH